MIYFLKLAHLLGVIVWVGGMFFAHMALRPVTAALLPPMQRLPLLHGVFTRFFPWVWVSVLLILLSGIYEMILIGGFKAGWHIHAMLAIGLAMMSIFSYIYFVPFSRMNERLLNQDWPGAGTAMARIRLLVGINLVLGLIVTAIALLGRLLVMGS